MTDKILTPITDAEQDRLDELTKSIKKGINMAEKSFALIVPGLVEVYNEMLYREHGSFANWAKAEFGWTDRNYRLYLDAGGVIESLKASGVEADDLNLSITKELHRVEPSDRADVYAAAKEVAGDSEITGPLVRKVTKEMADKGVIKYSSDRINANEAAANKKKAKGKDWTFAYDVYEDLPPIERKNLLGMIIDNMDELDISMLETFIAGWKVNRQTSIPLGESSD